jgi:hypothetical protein
LHRTRRNIGSLDIQRRCAAPVNLIVGPLRKVRDEAPLSRTMQRSARIQSIALAIVFLSGIPGMANAGRWPVHIDGPMTVSVARGRVVGSLYCCADSGVHSETEFAIKGVRLQLRSKNGRRVIASRTTQRDGRFDFGRLRPGRYSLWLWLSDNLGPFVGELTVDRQVGEGASILVLNAVCAGSDYCSAMARVE